MAATFTRRAPTWGRAVFAGDHPNNKNKLWQAPGLAKFFEINLIGRKGSREDMATAI